MTRYQKRNPYYCPDPLLTERERAIRAAALMDAEGSIMVNTQYQLRAQLTSTTPVILEWMRANFDGTIQPKVQISGNLPAWEWIVASQIAEDFLKAIRPFVILKLGQVNCGLGLRLHQGMHMRDVSLVEKQALWEPFRTQMLQINHALTITNREAVHDVD